jgi:hypothetical protein
MNYNEIQDLIKRLRDNTVLSFDETVEMLNQAAKELEDQLLLIEKQQKIIRRIYVDHFPDTYFVCGELGVKDSNGLPDKIEICPAYGVGWTQLYQKTDTTIMLEGS